MRMKILLILLVLVVTHAWAATYKCDVGGQVVYGDKPCEKGAGMQIAIKDALEPQSEKQLSSEEQLKREKQQAATLRKERLKREKADEKARQKAAKQAQKDEKNERRGANLWPNRWPKPPWKAFGQAKRQDPAKREAV